MRRSVLLVLAFIGLASCAGAGSQSRSSRQFDVITRDEIVQAGVGTALEAVEQLRPQFLRPRGGVSIREGGTPSPPQVFVDGLELGGPEGLRDIPASIILDIRYSPNRDTETRLGSGQHGGVIRVRTVRAG